MTENFKKFLELVSNDEEVKQKVLNINGMAKEDAVPAVIALAKEADIELTEADFAEKVAPDELSDDELDAVAGGKCDCFIMGTGGGTDSCDHKTYACHCSGSGHGGDGRKEDNNCSCSFLGFGTDYGNQS